MEKIVRNKYSSLKFLLAALLLNFTLLSFAATNDSALPEEGVKAEMESRWQDAVTIYKNELAKNPDRLDLWLRLADIYAQLKQGMDAANALQKAADIKKTDAFLYYQTAKAYSAADTSDQALIAINQAVKLAPNDLRYLGELADIAAWLKNQSLVQQTNKQILQLDPKNNKAILALAHAGMYGQDYAGAEDYFKQYLALNPQDKKVYLEYIRSQLFGDNYSSAVKSLENYKQQFSEDDDYLIELARYNAFTGEEKKALDILQPLSLKDPKNQSIIDIKNFLSIQAKNPNYKIKSLDSVQTIYKIQMLSLAGNYKETEKILAYYKKNYGEDNDYLIEQARYFALNAQPQRALEIIAPLKKNDPTNQTLIEIEQYALTHKNVPTPFTVGGTTVANKNIQAPVANKTVESPAMTVLQQAANKAGYTKTIPVSFYSKYLMQHPNDKAALIELITAYLLQGNYEQSEKQLATYKEKYGKDKDYLTEQARYLALIGNSQQALLIVEPLLKNEPDNSTLLDIKRYAASNQPAPQEHPTEQTALLGAISAYLLKGNYPQGEKQLAIYKSKYGEDKDYLTEQARYFALTNKSQQALALVLPLLTKDPTNSVLLDIKKYAENNKATAVAGKAAVPAVTPLMKATILAKRAETVGDNAVLYAEAADAYVAAGKAQEALLMISYALALQPDEYKYLKVGAKTATEAGNKTLAYQAYTELYRREPNDPEALLGLAQAAGNLGKLDYSRYFYAIYLKRYPDKPEPWIESVYIALWCGDNRAALQLLEQYYQRFGVTESYLKAQARALANAVRVTDSMEIVAPLLQKHPNDYDLNYTKTVDLFYGREPIAMFASLAKVNQINAKDPETAGLNDFIRTPFRSNVTADSYYSRDADTVEIVRDFLHGQYFVTPVWQILADARAERLSATVASGLAPINGDTSLDINTVDIGMVYRFNPYIAVKGIIGDAKATQGGNMLLYEGDAFINLSDTALLTATESRYFYDVSARAVSLGVKQQLNQLRLDWEPWVQRYLTAIVSYSSFSDDNSMRYINVLPRLGLVRTEKVNLNVGVSGIWYAFAKDLNDGYYDPLNYKYFALVADLYWKQSDNIGYGATIGIGRQKDETFTTFKQANDLAVKAFYGIYKDWYLELSSGVSTRGVQIGANVQGNGSSMYWVYYAEAALTRRF